MADERKIFSEQEVAALVKRAVQLQEQAQDAGDYAPGVTIEELRRIATELGVDPKHLEQAVREGAAPPSKKGPLHLTEEFERVVDVELAPDEFDILTSELRQVNSRGGLTQIGRSLQGQTWTGASIAHVNVSSRKGRTKIQVRSNALFAWLVSLHPASILCFVLLPILGAKGFILPAIAGAVGLMGLAYGAFRGLLKRGHEAARAMADRLADRIREEGTSPRDNLAQATDRKPEETERQQVSW